MDFKNDDSIIDVTAAGSFLLPKSDLNPTNEDVTHQKPVVPKWEHHYVYSYSEINGATREQQEFYQLFKGSFLREICWDLEDNTNYAFILLFDLLDNYKNHQNLAQLEAQLNRLKVYYPVTRPYTISLLIKSVEAQGSIADVERLRSIYNYWNYGDKYRTKLGLDDYEVKLLNKVCDTNRFRNIEFYCTEAAKLYLSSPTELF